MKKLIIVLVLLGVAMSTLMQSTSQGTLRGQNGAHVLRKSNLGRALMQMVQMYVAEKDSGRKADKLFDAIDTLKDSLRAKYKKEMDDYASEKKTHDGAVKDITDKISGLEAALTIHQSELTSLKGKADDLTASLLNQQGYLRF